MGEGNVFSQAHQAINQMELVHRAREANLRAHEAYVGAREAVFAKVK
jgi:hypothetical protein